MNQKVLGGPYGLEFPAGEGGLFAHWNLPADLNYFFRNARSALSALCKYINPPRVWIPTYICKAVLEALSTAQVRVYPVGQCLAPNSDWLNDALMPGDVVLGVNYFGKSPDREFLSLVKHRKDITFIEDCAHTIDTGQAHWGTWRLYSPRKLLGVCDGGILAPSLPSDAPPFKTVPSFDLNVFTSSLMRLEDSDEELWPEWHEANERYVMDMQITNRRMTQLSIAILKVADPQRMIARRKTNFAVLAERLSELAFLEGSEFEAGLPNFTPFGFPIRLPNSTRNILRSTLFERGIYAGRHWEPLPDLVQEFEEEAVLSRELLTLPCDQRYDEDDMDTIANVLLTILRETGVSTPYRSR